MEFYKYHGTGNDFILVDNRDMGFPDNVEKVVPQLCHRRFGVGADGVILLQKIEGFDFEMVYYNADGRPSSMCGNGARCISAFARDLGLVTRSCSFMAVDGPHSASFESGEVALKMADVRAPLPWGDGMKLVNTGSPHLLKFLAEGETVDVESEGRALRNHPDFAKEGVNVNFVWLEKDGSLTVRTYERGVEAETWSCGTGVTAAAIAAHGLTQRKSFDIKTLGGKLNVKFEPDDPFKNVYLSGPAVKVFKGNYNF